MASTSSLLKSAASIRNQLATYQDQLMAYEYSNSAYTDSALSSYSNYLKSRIGSLSTAPSITNASKALTLTKALDSATKKNISATIQRENIQVLSGNATLTDKYNVISDQFVRAQANGDMTLAQTLEGQAYSLNQSIQQQRQTSATAAAAAGGKDWANTATDLKTALDKFNTEYTNAGQKTAASVVADFVKQMQPELAKAGIQLQPGTQPNYFDIVDGVNRAIYKSYQNAATVIAPYDTTGASVRDFTDKANATITSIPTIYGTMNAQQLAQAQSNPGQFTYKEDPQWVTTSQGGTGGKLMPQTGYQQTANGIQPTYSSSPWLDIPNNLNNQIQSLKLRIVTGAGNGTEVTATAQSPDWVKQIIPSNATTHIMSNSNGQLQFEADSVNGSGKAIYTIAKDNTVWESSNTGDRLIANPDNVNQQYQQPQSVFGRIGSAFMSGVNQVDTLLNAKAYADALPSSMLSQATSHYTLPPLPVAKPLQLPSLSVAAPTAQPVVPSAPPINPYPTAPTASPQTTAPSSNIQGGSTGLSVQGGGMSLQGGGAAISLQ
jgi:hypothetical protein